VVDVRDDAEVADQLGRGERLVGKRGHSAVLKWQQGIESWSHGMNSALRAALQDRSLSAA
jgi:hypothetical protein